MREIDFSSTSKITDSQLQDIMKEVAIDAKKREQKSTKALFAKLNKEIKSANARFNKQRIKK